MPGVLDKAKTAADLVGPWAILLYGVWGGGKTVLACQASGPLLIDIDPGNGSRSLLNHPELVDTPVRKAYTLGEAQQVEIDLRTDTDERVKTVIADTVTSLQGVDLDTQMKKIAQDPQRNGDLPSQAEFNINNRRIARFCKDLITTCNKAGRNVIIVCHDKEEKDKEGFTVAIRPGTSPALTQMIAPMFDGIFYLDSKARSTGVMERTLKTVPTNVLRSKNRFADLPVEIKDPHFSIIEEAAEKQVRLAQELIKSRETQIESNQEKEKANA